MTLSIAYRKPIETRRGRGRGRHRSREKIQRQIKTERTEGAFEKQQHVVLVEMLHSDLEERLIRAGFTLRRCVR